MFLYNVLPNSGALVIPRAQLMSSRKSALMSVLVTRFNAKYGKLDEVKDGLDVLMDSLISGL
jgi:hypothetical protein